MANNNRSIDPIFKPTKDGYLGQGSYGLTYKGILLLNGMEIAMKFTELKNEDEAKQEYKIYTYLNAINNPNTEAYGVPTIYYYGTWNDHVMMAMTLLDSEFHKRFDGGKFNEIDLLITFREFVS